MLATDLAAHGVFLLIERFLLGRGDMASIHFGHRALFLANSAIFLMQLLSLPFANFAFAQLIIDSLVLVLQPIVDLLAARMIGSPVTLRERRRRRRTE